MNNFQTMTPFSTMGSRQGVDDPSGRGRIIAALAAKVPRAFLLENMPRVLPRIGGRVARRAHHDRSNAPAATVAAGTGADRARRVCVPIKSLALGCLLRALLRQLCRLCPVLHSMRMQSLGIDLWWARRATRPPAIQNTFP